MKDLIFFVIIWAVLTGLLHVYAMYPFIESLFVEGGYFEDYWPLWPYHKMVTASAIASVIVTGLCFHLSYSVFGYDEDSEDLVLDS